MGEVEKQLRMVTWAVKQLKRYTAFAPKVRVHLPQPDALHVVHNANLHYKLSALLIELSMYNVEWVDGPGAGQLLGSFLAPECLDDVSTEKGEQLQVPQWKHPGDYQVVAPDDTSK